MSSSWGTHLQLTVFGESHSRGIGGVLDNLPPGLPVDEEEIRFELRRRATGMNAIATARREADEPEIMSGVFQGKTTGTPLAFVIKNGDTRSGDYDELRTVARPSHADYTGFLRYEGCGDYRGGGHFSGRLTAPIVFGGAIAKTALRQKDIYTVAHVARIAEVWDAPLDLAAMTVQRADELKHKDIPTVSDAQGKAMFEAALAAKREADSVGGVIECAMMNMPAGYGDPMFGAFESRLSALLFSIPAVKGVEFGAGFGFATMRGSEANDSFVMENGTIRTRTNHNGGINGGITNGMPVVVRVVIKPTPSIGQEQKTVDFVRGEDRDLIIHGRHDACIVLRAVSVIESCMALCALDFLSGERGAFSCES